MMRLFGILLNYGYEADEGKKPPVQKHKGVL